MGKVLAGDSHRDIESTEDPRSEGGGPGPKIDQTFENCSLYLSKVGDHQR